MTVIDKTTAWLFKELHDRSLDVFAAKIWYLFEVMGMLITLI